MNESGRLRTADAKAIWHAGVAAVDPAPLVERTISCREQSGCLTVQIHGHVHSLGKTGRLFVLGMGKASALMAEGLERSCSLLMNAGRLRGLINIPEGSPGHTKVLELWSARPAGCNEPTAAGVEGSRRMIQLLDEATDPDDIIVCLVSGGGSALLPMPIDAITLEEKLAVTRFLSGAGANIGELNTVRKQLSQVKGGGLRRLCSGRRLVSLLLSDVPGDPLDIIASGCTVPNTTTAADAMAVLHRFHGERHEELRRIFDALNDRIQKEKTIDTVDDRRHENLIIGSNTTAVMAAANEARARGYCPLIHSSTVCEGEAEKIGRALLEESCMIFSGQASECISSLFWPNVLAKISDGENYDCIISGGEPVVQLAPAAIRGLGGRNTQLVLAALIDVLNRDNFNRDNSKGATIPVFLSGGTDGEDGPTESAGAYFDTAIVARVRELIRTESLVPEDYLRRNDTWHFFERVGGLFTPGATGTNVCDLRIVLK